LLVPFCLITINMLYTPMAEESVRRLGWLLVLAVLCYHLLFAEGGALGYMRAKRELGAVKSATAKLERENIRLMAEIDKLQKDDQYLEEVARKKYGLLREGERLYRIEK
jgi:cell division protein FtsB